MRSALVTIVSGRLRHLRRQVEGVRTSTLPPDLHVVAAMDRREIPRLRALCGPSTKVIAVPRRRDALPLAAALNVGARAADTPLKT